MTEELGKIEKPLADDYKEGRRLYFAPLIYCGEENEAEYLKIFNKYWRQIETQITDLETKLGLVKKIYYELVTVDGEDGVKAIKGLHTKCYEVIKRRLDKGARLEAIEKSELLTEFLDWSRCLAVGLQNQEVFTKIFESYTEVKKKRNEYITRQVDKTLEADESGILFMREGHEVQFPPDIQVFYVAPPTLDEIKRWFRDRNNATKREEG